MSRGPWKHKRKQKAAWQVVDADPVLSLADIDPVITVADAKPKLSRVSDADIAQLPPSIRYQIEAVTRARRALKMPDNLRERQEGALRAFRGDRPR